MRGEEGGDDWVYDGCVDGFDGEVGEVVVVGVFAV